MLMPMLWSNNDIFDEMDDFFNRGFWNWTENGTCRDGACQNGRAATDHQNTALSDRNGFAGASLMRTDVIEKEDSYQLEADLPGFNKEDIKIDLKNDILTISAQHSENNDEKDEGGKYIRRERRSSSYQRSFRVENLKPEDIIAQYRNGVLTVNIPKKEALPEKEEAARIEVKD
ncbi:Hsp20/alpha crystallin family protein [Butyrivibrio sp. INlla14]|uniref:Hsp20/alpha crystallin family protein n=1 Tax=Butyrivibrio sp. INlla14 TaxID=1520808 RepID=UPI00087732EB|nr:Hsp20/alpha crystallin family protein [Butyrivibrio sp. INlla14]SCY34798.1 Molecular chaperone IbpA, HSP20 family [Butyrivibrio sp. INlla14]